MGKLHSRALIYQHCLLQTERNCVYERGFYQTNLCLGFCICLCIGVQTNTDKLASSIVAYIEESEMRQTNAILFLPVHVFFNQDVCLQAHFRG